jgi:hypothetical protein
MNDAEKTNKIFNRKTFILLGAVILLIIGLIIILPQKEAETNTDTPPANANTESSDQQTSNYVPPQEYYLSDEQKSLLNQTLSSSGFLEALPDKGIIGLKFYDFVNGERIWLNRVLISKEGFVGSGEPDMTLFMHAKYVSQLNGSNLCEVIAGAKTNGEMWVESEQSDTKLFFKYSGMMEYKDCLGF